MAFEVRPQHSAATALAQAETAEALGATLAAAAAASASSSSCVASGADAEEAGTAALDELLALLRGDPPPTVRDRLLEALCRLDQRGHPEVCSELLRLLDHRSWGARAGALRALGRLADPQDAGVAEALTARLEDGNSGVRSEVPAALAELARACDAAGDVAGGGDDGDDGGAGMVKREQAPAVKREDASVPSAAQACGRRKLAALVRPRLSHRSWTVRQAAAEALAAVAGFPCGSSSDPVAAPGTLAVLADLRENEAATLAAVLAGEPPPLCVVVPELAAMLADEAPGVRERALRCLVAGASLPGAGAVGDFAPGDAVAAAAVRVVAGPKVAAQRDPAVRACAALALGALCAANGRRGDAKALEALVRLRKDVNTLVRVQAVKSFGLVASTGVEAAAEADAASANNAFQVAAAHLQDTAEEVRRAAADALVSLAEASGSFTAALVAARPACSQSSASMRRAAQEACGRLEARLLAVKAETSTAQTKEEDPERSPLAGQRQRPQPDDITRGLRSFLAAELRCEAPGAGRPAAAAAAAPAPALAPAALKAESYEPDFVGEGLKTFLAGAKRRSGPVSALDVHLGPSASKRRRREEDGGG
eukprot:TRINITY_DN24588_c0_g4_i1.p1 TRINITY_DN24588_c0_g4~~TRINITY_DN24588_c0_g4_i1.p1  ORF type:complete len:616 (-),score=165.79 TRINITY_DN24588_c0_g4_i1:103-1896(-)